MLMKTLQDYMGEQQTAAFKEHGAFFAFGQKQFDEKKEAGVVYSDMGHGLICPKGKCLSLFNALETLYDEALDQQIKEHDPEQIVRHEYFNRETQITNDTAPAREALEVYVQRAPAVFTEELIDQVFKACFEEACANNWF